MMAGRIQSENSPGTLGQSSGYKDGVFYSNRPPGRIPNDPYLDFTSFTFQSGKYLDRVALVDAPTGESLSYREVTQQVKSVASGLADIGVKQGDVVMILSPNSLQFPVLMLAITSIGAAVTSVNPLNTTKEIVLQAEDSKTKYLAAVPGLTAAAAILRIPLILIDHTGIQASTSKSEVTPVAYFSGLLQADPRTAPKVRIRQTDTAVVLYSSGTTGVSKGVVISHGNVIASIACRSEDSSYREDEQRTYIVTIPMYHMYGMIIVVGTQLKLGSKLVMLPKYELSKFLAAIERHKVTHAQTVPPIFNALARSSLVAKYDLTSLTHVTVGAAPIPEATMILCSKRFKNAFLRQGYALTESTGMGTTSSPADSSPRLGSVGLLVANMEAMIIDLESGKPLPPNQRGEIWLRGPYIMQGYLNNEKATAETLDKQGWLHTGDVGYFNEDGYLYLVDRLKELIKYNGYQVAPAELEAVLSTHPQIEDVTVAGSPDELHGQIPVAFVVRHKNSSLSEPEVIQFVAKQTIILGADSKEVAQLDVVIDRLANAIPELQTDILPSVQCVTKVAPYKKVRKVVFVDSIPRLPSGKIIRRHFKLPTFLETSKL